MRQITHTQKIGHSQAEATLTKKRWFLSLLKPDLGRRSITEINATDIIAPLKRIEVQGNYETARRTRAFASQVFRYAIATARGTNDPTFGLRGALISPKAKHRAAITDRTEFGKLLRAIWSYSGQPQTVAALKLMALLYSRPGELRQTSWDEFDLANSVWTIPAERAKTRKEHKKPLTEASVSILSELKQLTGHEEFAFPAIGARSRPLSENTMNQALRRMGFDQSQHTAHGFRATASTMLNESGKWSSDAIEAELAHIDTNAVRRAYHRASVQAFASCCLLLPMYDILIRSFPCNMINLTSVETTFPIADIQHRNVRCDLAINQPPENRT